VTVTPSPTAGASTVEQEAAARDEGAATALSHADHQALADHIRQCARKFTSFTADDIHAEMTPGLAHKLDAFPNAIGGAVLAAAKRNEIRNTGKYVQSDRQGRRRGRIAVWEEVRHA
jgi:hypothetical protein